MRIHIAVLTFLSALITISIQSPVRVHLAMECSNFGYIENNKCVCLDGMKGSRCNQFVSTMCVDGKCPTGTICHPDNVDCLFTNNCLDKRGWCLPLNFPPTAEIEIEQVELYPAL